MSKFKHIHFVGIKGVGMTPLAIIAKEAGFVVTGCDIADGFITDEILQKSGITPVVGFSKQHLHTVDLLITTGAHGGYDNPEVIAAKKQKIPVWTQGEAVGKYMAGELFVKRNLTGISITGTHGKTTTTAMVAKILMDVKKDPSWIIGTSQIPSLGWGGHYGKGKFFVAEADEYANEPTHDKTPKMLLQKPKLAVITNIEHDHPDIYLTVEDAYKAFLAFAKLLPNDGVLITCGDDTGVKEVLKNYSKKVLTYGFGKKNIYRIENLSTTFGGSQWGIVYENKKMFLKIQIPGQHNILNATAAAIVGLQCDVSIDEINTALFSFSGTKRRLEYIGQLVSGALLYDDYAHHPTEIRKTLEALREKYPKKHIVCIFQPHTFSRTKLLFEQFIDSLGMADEVIMTDIYASQREAFDLSISSEMITQKLHTKRLSVFAKTLSDVVKYVHQKQYSQDTIVLTMGAGDIYTIANSLLERE